MQNLFKSCFKFPAFNEITHRKLKVYESFELRHYDKFTTLKVKVPGPFELALKNGQEKLREYLQGHNYKQKKFQGHLPLMLTSRPEGWEVSFTLPPDLTVTSAPKPIDQHLMFEEVMARKVAVINFRGRISYSSFVRNMDCLRNWAEGENFKAILPSRLLIHGWTTQPSFIRRNEIHIDVS